ncbi:HYR domain-containing protein [Streptomyces olivoreticuli]|uniref:HYR domain-containing protein n=1 Tax=Streptomyces olivoreticuli TaxID=68246 RepID=UPI001F07D822|nr:HYR domain-containing protein [Streptomyces olivoreticuli]
MRRSLLRAASWAGGTGRDRTHRITVLAVALTLLMAVVPGAAADRSAAWWTVMPQTVDGTLEPGKSLPVDKQVRTPAVPPRPDVVLMVDGTFSMDGTIKQLKSQGTLESITKRVRDVQPDSRFAVTTYGDVVDGKRAFEVLQGLTYDLAAVGRGVNALTSDRGLDSPGPAEDWINALWQTANGASGQFREGANPVIVLIGDSSSHDPSLGHTLTDAIDALKSKGVRVVAVDIKTYLGDDLNGDGTGGGGNHGEGRHEPNEATKVVEATNGSLLKDVDPKQVADNVVKGLTNLPTTVGYQTLGCDPALTVALDPPRRQVTSGDVATFKETVTAAKDAPQGRTVQCTVQFLMDGKLPGGPASDYQERITIKVRDVTAPQITVEGRTVEATGRSGAKIDYTATANDNVDGDLPVTCDPPSGAQFPLGTTRVTCTATDSAGNKGTGTALFTVQDASAPKVTVDDRTVAATDKSGARIDYTATAKDDVDGDLPVACAPASGSLFPLGTTRVTCTATDSAGNKGSATATFTVLPAPVPDMADLAVAVNVGPVPNYTGRTTQARFTLANTGPRTAEGVVLTTAWPDGTPDKRSLTRLSACTQDNPCRIPVGGRVTVTQSAVYGTAVGGDVRASVRGSLPDPRQDNNTATAPLRVLRPELTITPEVGRPGQVVRALGKDFPPGVLVRLTWQPGITAARAPVRVGRDGTFDAQVLVLRKDRLGPRVLRAQADGLDPFQRPFLVVQRNQNPPDFAGRG